jgi:hypothetical protein
LQLALLGRLYSFASNFLVLRDNPILNHLPRFVPLEKVQLCPGINLT